MDDVLKLQTLPPGDQIVIDLSDPGRSTLRGAFRQEVPCADRARSMITYMPENWQQNNRCIVVAPPSGRDVLSFLEESGLRAFAEQTKVLLCIIDPEGRPWNTDGSDCAFMNAAFKKAQARDGYVVMQDAVYAMGFGDGAVIAQQAVLSLTGEYSGLATFGPITEAVLQPFAGDTDIGRQDEELFISGKRAQLPVWMIVPEENAAVKKLLRYWCLENRSLPEPLLDPFGSRIYLPEPLKNTSKLNDDNIARTCLTVAGSDMINTEFLLHVWNYIGAARRHRSYGGKVLRYFRDPLKTGAEHHTLEIDGMLREWYEYVPERFRNSSTPLPLVVCFHGRGGNGETFYDVTDMSLMAEERGFIAAFPTGDIYQIREGGFRGVRLWNGNFMGRELDSLPFIRKLVADIQRRRPVDRGRIYAFGQSSGGHMAVCCAMKASDLFCAAAPCSGFTFPGFKTLRCPDGPLFTAGKVPMLFLLGKEDKLFGGAKTFDPLPEELPCGQFLRYIRDTYGLQPEPGKYRAYPTDFYEWYNDGGIPVLQAGLVEDMPHANYAEQSRIIYDTFFAKWHKNDAGDRFYMGKRI